MAAVFVFKIRSSCPECGESLAPAGPTQSITCDGCQTVFPIPGDDWKDKFGFRADCEERGLTEGKTRGSSMMAGERKFLVSWGPQRPLCVGCGALLNLANVGPGSVGEIPCACGKTTPTCPPPAWLAAADPTVLQLFAVPLELPAGASPVGGGAGTKPISFACPDCGANLKITSESPRVLGCTYCQADLYLPDPLWRALHPVKKRAAFYVAFT